jgi:hypothetical protein
MTTVAEISLQIIKQVTDWKIGAATDGAANYLKDVNSLIEPNQHFDRGTVWINSGTHAGKVLKILAHANNKLTFAPLGSVLCVQQVETATVVGSITLTGNATVVITAANMVNSPKTISVGVVNADTASAVATKIRTALAADTDVNNFFTIGGSGADITLTTKVAVANDATMNMSIANGTCTGLTAAPTSTNTTASIAGPRYTLIRGAYPWDQLIGSLNTAFDDENSFVTHEDETLTGDGSTKEFTLPAGVSRIYAVRFKRSSDASYHPPSSHWSERNGKLVFAYAPFRGDTLHIFYRKHHDDVSLYSDTIHIEINTEWLALATAKELLFWGAQQYGKKSEYMIEERLNNVLNALKGMQPRIGGPDVMITTAGA